MGCGSRIVAFATGTSFLLALSLMLCAPHATAGWQLVAEGDCIGPQIQGGAGSEPDEALCGRELAGKTALCFPRSCNPGCQYLDIPTDQCLPGADNGLIYTCFPDRTL
jgi:hypothetical protein